MVHGFEPVEGLDYTETFVSMVKPMSCKAMYATAAANDWEIEQMNAKATFLSVFALMNVICFVDLFQNEIVLFSSKEMKEDFEIVKCELSN
jgi:hypothetical protein